jgi:hypothetical protein
MPNSNGRGGVTDRPEELEGRSLREDLKRDYAPTPAEAARLALESPYTLRRWGEELRQLSDGVPTGFDALDELGMRWLPGKLTAIIARPGGGKTGLLLEATLRFLENNPTKTALFLSWEEPLADLFARLVLRMDAAKTRDSGSFSGPPIFSGTVRGFGRDPNAGDVGTFAARLATATRALEVLLPRLRLVDGDELGRDTRAVFSEAAAWMRSEAEKEDGAQVGLVAVDYFQKLRAGVGFSRQTELQDVADTLRRFAKGASLATIDDGGPDTMDKRYAVPVLVGAQVNRSALVEAHPTGDQIREADDLLNDSAAVIALSWEVTSSATAGDESRTLRLSVPKHRNGRNTEKVAGYAWHPARHWLDTGALRDASSGAITWRQPPKKEEPGEGRGTAKRSKEGKAPAVSGPPAEEESF